MKRFYQEVAVAAGEEGFGVTLDGKPVKTPAGQTLAVPTAALAGSLADEWSAQGETIVPATMPLMQLVTTAIDRMPLTRGHVLGYVAGFGASDVLCYRAEQPSDLAAMQAARWQPWLDWARRDLGASLSVTTGIVPVTQDPDSVAVLRTRAEASDDWTLTALQSLAPCLGSLVLALAVVEGKLEPDTAFELSRLDEAFQNERWGLDSDAKARNDGLRQEILAAARMLELLREV